MVVTLVEEINARDILVKYSWLLSIRPSHFSVSGVSSSAYIAAHKVKVGHSDIYIMWVRSTLEFQITKTADFCPHLFKTIDLCRDVK